MSEKTEHDMTISLYIILLFVNKGCEVLMASIRLVPPKEDRMSFNRRPEGLISAVLMLSIAACGGADTPQSETSDAANQADTQR